jgi:hypothetical protein
VDAGQVPVPAPTEDLAVERQVVVPVRVAVGQPVPDEAVQVIGIQGGEQVGEGVGTRHVPVPEAEGVTQWVPAEASELGDGGPAGVPGQGGDHCQRDERHEWAGDPPRVAGVSQLGQAIEQRRGGHRRPPERAAEGIPTSPTFTNPNPCVALDRTPTGRVGRCHQLVGTPVVNQVKPAAPFASRRVREYGQGQNVFLRGGRADCGQDTSFPTAVRRLAVLF